MLENIFTTKMSMDKKILQQRFFKIRSKSSFVSKLMAIIIFLAVITLIVSSAIYIASKKNDEDIPVYSTMTDIEHIDDKKTFKSFEMSDFTGMKDVLLEIGGNEYALTDFKDLLTVENIMSNAKMIKGGTKCSFDAKLIIKNQKDEYSKIELATDSCATFRINGVYYDYSDGDNSALYGLFGISSKELRNLAQY